MGVLVGKGVEWKSIQSSSSAVHWFFVNGIFDKNYVTNHF